MPSHSQPKKGKVKGPAKKGGLAGGVAKGPSHAQINGRLRDIGGQMRYLLSAPRKSKPLDNPKGHKPDFFKEVLHNRALLGTTAFKDAYRRRLPAHDELLSASALREVVTGLLMAHDKKPMTALEIENANELFNDISATRMPTAYCGYALSSADVMQHPTSRKKALFADPTEREVAKRHSALDRQRKEHVAVTMGDALKQPGASAETVTQAGNRAASIFSLNVMIAPITAQNVKQHALKGHTASKAQQNEQLRLRERIKRIAGPPKTTQSPDAAWGAFRQDLRSASPARMPL